MSNLVSQTYYIFSTVQRYDKEREKTNKFQVLSSYSIFITKVYYKELGAPAEENTQLHFAI